MMPEALLPEQTARLWTEALRERGGEGMKDVMFGGEETYCPFGILLHDVLGIEFELGYSREEPGEEIFGWVTRDEYAMFSEPAREHAPELKLHTPLTPYELRVASSYGGRPRGYLRKDAIYDMNNAGVRLHVIAAYIENVGWYAPRWAGLDRVG